LFTGPAATFQGNSENSDMQVLLTATPSLATSHLQMRVNCCCYPPLCLRGITNGYGERPTPPFDLKGEAIFSLVNIIYMMAGNNYLK
jgi:hypothetical protein